MNKSDIARKYRDKYGMDMPTLKLARIIYGENNLTFKSIEDARFTLRYIEGKAGEKRIKSVINNPEYLMQTDRPKNPYNLPESFESDFAPFVIKGHKKVLILSDVHLPYHNIEALTVALDYGKKEQPDAILLNGDILDCHKLSRFVKDPKKRDFASELASFKDFFAILQKTFPKAKVYYKLGNHEERYQHFLLEKAHELIGVEEFDLANIIKARAAGIEVISDKRPIRMNNLWGLHGHEYPGGISAPVNPARGLFLRAKLSCFQGHTHQTSEHTEPTLSGSMVTTFSIGCLSELHPAYMPLNKWNHGFGFVELGSDGESFEFRNKRIYKGKLL